MTRDQAAGVDGENATPQEDASIARLGWAKLATLLFAVWIAVSGCQTPATRLKDISQPAPGRLQSLSLREGDVLKITFPGAPNLNTTQQIRRDGKIALPLVGELSAAGMSPAELEKEILKLYASQLVSKEVTVTVEASAFPVFVTGAVIRPGKVSSDHPITALEAIMEAGGFDYARANLRAVRVIRQDDGQSKNYILNLKLTLEGTQTEPFYLKPADIVYVPERFSWF